MMMKMARKLAKKLNMGMVQLSAFSIEIGVLLMVTIFVGIVILN